MLGIWPDKSGWYWMIGYGSLRIIEIKEIDSRGPILIVEFHGTGDSSYLGDFTHRSGIIFYPIEIPAEVKAIMDATS